MKSDASLFDWSKKSRTEYSEKEDQNDLIFMTKMKIESLAKQVPICWKRH